MQLPSHQVQARHGLSHRMLDLQTRIHFHQVKSRAIRIRKVVIEQKFYRASTFITRRQRQLHRTATHAFPQNRIYCWAGRFFDDFLVPTLHRAIPLTQVDTVAVLVGKDLYLHVAWLQERPFDQQLRTATGRQGF